MSPEIEKLENAIADEPVFVSVTAWVELTDPTVVESNEMPEEGVIWRVVGWMRRMRKSGGVVARLG